MAYERTDRSEAQQALTALADPTRRHIFDELRCGPRSVRALADVTPVSRPAVSQHLKVLKQAGLVQESPVGTRRLYSVRAEGLSALRSWLDGYWEDVMSAYQREVEKDG